MAYDEAIRAFANSVKHCDTLVDAKWKPFIWDLSTGLNALARDLQKDMAEIHAQLGRLAEGSGRPK